jgi:hypothetical protein
MCQVSFRADSSFMQLGLLAHYMIGRSPQLRAAWLLHWRLGDSAGPAFIRYAF